MTHRSTQPSRRSFLRHSAGLASVGLALAYAPTVRATAPTRSLAFEHLHTGEKMSLVYAEGGAYVPQALTRLNQLLRDHYSGEVGVIDPPLFDLLFEVQQTLGANRPFQVISGFRGAATNAHLKSTRGGGVASKSLHMEGRAIDIRIAGVPLTDLRTAALSLRSGGVGFYARDQFVHVDTGRVRAW
jgi:uncharacterized protein YcbK (DUF882 family)